MKRLLSLLLVIAMLFSVCTMFAACDGNTVSSEDKEKEEEKKSNKVDLSMKDVTVEEAVVFEKYGLILTLEDVDSDSESVIFTFTLENTSDECMSLQSSSCLVNGISSVYNRFHCYLDSGESTTEELYLSVEHMEWMGITTIGHLDMEFRIIDSNYNVVEENIPVTIETSKVGFVHTPPTEGEVLFEAEGIRMVALETSFKKNSLGHGVFVFVENQAEELRHVNLSNSVLNGWVLPYTIFSLSLPAGTNTVQLIDLSGLENIGIKKADDVQNLYFDISLSDEEYYLLYDKAGIGYCPGDKDFVKKIDISGEVLYEDDNIQLIQNSLTVHDGSIVLELYSKNTGDETYRYSFDGFFVNGNQHYFYSTITLPAGTQNLNTVYLWISEELVSKEDLESLSGRLLIYTDDYYDVYADVTVDFVLD